MYLNLIRQDKAEDIYKDEFTEFYESINRKKGMQ
jgi:hypothetical protein